jgi:hypothetical protein
MALELFCWEPYFKLYSFEFNLCLVYQNSHPFICESVNSTSKLAFYTTTTITKDIIKYSFCLYLSRVYKSLFRNYKTQQQKNSIFFNLRRPHK